MHKLICRFVTTTKEKKIPNRNLDTSCPAGISCNKLMPMQCTSLSKNVSNQLKNDLESSMI